MHVDKPSSQFESCIDLIVLSFIWIFIGIYLDARLIFSDTIVTGGDTASWYQIAEHLKHILIPNGRLFGWDMGNFCGYPNFSFYFIPPFLLAVLLSYTGIPLTIALKLMIVSGWYLLPISVYYGLRLMNYRFPAPVLGAFSALLFLFNESYTMFGGNVLSTLAGEFCYMFAFSILPYYTGSMVKGFTDESRVIRNGFLIGLIGLSHLFVFIPAVTVVLYGFFNKKRVAYVIQVCAIGFGVMVFWILPLIAWRKLYTIPVYMIWQSFISWKIFFIACAILLIIFFPIVVWQKPFNTSPPKKKLFVYRLKRSYHYVLPLLCIMILIYLLGYGLFSILTSEHKDFVPGTGVRITLSIIWILWFAVILFFSHMGKIANRKWLAIQIDWQVWGWIVCCCMIMYCCAHFLQVPDIRFVPPVLLILIIVCASNYIGHYLSTLPCPVKYASLIFCIASILVSTILSSSNAPKWYAYNFNGYENTSGYKNLCAVSSYLNQTNSSNPLNAPRVGYEKCDRYGPYGGDRVFESLPLWSGRQTLEGIHYSSSIASKFITFLQTEFSKEIKTPTPYILSRINPQSAAIHMSMYNISQLILMTKTAKTAFNKSPLFVHEKDIDDFSIYRLKQQPSGYVVPVKHLPILFTGNNWLERFYQDWFKFPEKSEICFVPDLYVTHPEDRAVFQAQTDRLDIHRKWFQQTISLKNNSHITSHLSHLKISFHTDAIGVPHLIRVSYYPNWKVHGAHGVYPVTPHFMMVIPRSSNVTLTYSHCKWEMIGGFITGFTIIFLLFALIIRQFFSNNLLLIQFKQAWFLIRQQLYYMEKPILKTQWALWVAIVVVSIFFSILGLIYRNQPVRTFVNGNHLYEKGIALQKQMNLKQAELTFKHVIDILDHVIANRFQYDHQDVINCLLLTAHSYEQLKKYSKAQDIYTIIITDYPYCRYVAESYVKKSRLFRKYRKYHIKAAIRSLKNGDQQTGLKYLNRSLEQTLQSVDHLKKAITENAQTQWKKTAQKELVNELSVLEIIQNHLSTYY